MVYPKPDPEFSLENKGPMALWDEERRENDFVVLRFISSEQWSPLGTMHVDSHRK